MTQITFSPAETTVPASKLNIAVQGYRFLKRTKYQDISLLSPVIHTLHPRAAALLAIAVGAGGGGGGGGAGTALQLAAGSGGGGGGYAEIFTSSSQVLRSPLTIVAPSGAPGGSPGTAGQGGFSFDAVVRFINSAGVSTDLVRGGGGFGGNAMSAGNDLLLLLGSLGGEAFGGNINMAGQAGYVGVRFDYVLAMGGRGGNSRKGVGGSENADATGGKPGTYYGGGGGGGGGGSGTGGFNGGGGGGALVMLDEYY